MFWIKFKRKPTLLGSDGDQLLTDSFNSLDSYEDVPEEWTFSTLTVFSSVSAARKSGQHKKFSLAIRSLKLKLKVFIRIIPVLHAEMSLPSLVSSRKKAVGKLSSHCKICKTITKWFLVKIHQLPKSFRYYKSQIVSPHSWRNINITCSWKHQVPLGSVLHSYSSNMNWWSVC